MIQGTKIYKVEISGGQIDNHKASDYKEFYTDDVYNTVNGVTTDLMKNKAKALVRFNNVAMALQKGLDTMFDIQTTGDDPKTVASKIEFKLAYTQDDGLWVECDKGTENAEQLRDGRYVVKGPDAIKKLITDACIKHQRTIVEYYETQYSVDSNTNETGRKSTAPCGWSFAEMDIEKTTPSVTVEEVVDITSKFLNN